MQLYKTLELRPAQLEKIYHQLGGRYSFWERLKRGGVGSPMLYYADGIVELDQLQNLAPDELRINFELLKAGVLMRIAERTNSYFIPIAITEISAIELTKNTDQMYLTLTTKDQSNFVLWSQEDQYYDWKSFLHKSFLLEFC